MKKQPVGKSRLDLLLVEKGHAETRSKAQALIMAGHVRINSEVIDKSGTLVSNDAAVMIEGINPYVSRGGLKLEGALRGMGISVRDMICMDIGASTGGFTDCLLQHGAVRVYAVDVGRNQLHPRIKQDTRVVSIEGVNFRYFSCKTLNEQVEFATIDVSFISLEKILPSVMPCLVPQGAILALVKPQFESRPEDLRKGVVRDEAIRQRAITKIRAFATGLGMKIKGGIDSELKGPRGNREHFLWMEK